MIRPGRAALLVLLIPLATGSHAAGAGLRDLQDGWLLAPEDLDAVLTTVRAGAPGSGWRLRCGVGTGRLYGLPELPLASLDLCLMRRDAPRPWSVRATWQATGTAAYRSQSWRFACAVRGAWRIGLRLVREHTLLAGEPGPGHDERGLWLGRRWRGDGWRAVADLLVPLEQAPATAERRPRPVARARWRNGRLAVALACDRRGGGPLLLGGELALGAGGAALLVRYDGGSASLGPGLAVRTRSVLLRTSHALHPVLGTSHRVEIVWGARGW